MKILNIHHPRMLENVELLIDNEYTSSVAWGTWSFDVHVTDTPSEHFYVFSMASEWNLTMAYGYDILISNQENWQLKRTGNVVSQTKILGKYILNNSSMFILMEHF